jgi:hypothetical protein
MHGLRHRHVHYGIMLLVTGMSMNALGTIRRVAFDAHYEHPELVPDGASWATAYWSLQDAIDDSSLSGGDVIWVKGNTTGTAIYRAPNTGGIVVDRAVYPYQGATMVADRCWFVGNSAPSPEVSPDPDDQLAAYNNGPGTGGAIWVNTECLDGQGGCAGSGITDEHAVAHVYNSLGAGNYAEGEGGFAYLEKAGHAKLVNCTIMNNAAGEAGGGVLADSGLDPGESDADYNSENCLTQVYDCIVWGNTDHQHDPFDLRAELYDEAVPTESNTWPTVDYSCIKSGLSGTPALSSYLNDNFNIGDTQPDEEPDVAVTYAASTWGGNGWESAVYNSETGRTTFTDNQANFSNLQNLIFAVEGPPETPLQRSIIISSSGQTMTVYGDLTAFVSGVYVVEDYRLPESSPCVDAGNHNYNGKPYDVLGNSRTFYEIDMGCYEITYVP